MGPDDRAVHRRLVWFRHVDEVTHNVAKTHRYFGISWQTYYRYRRYGKLGESGLRNGSSRPLHSPRVTPSEIVEKVLYLRRCYHFGPARICMHLRRYHALTISQSGIWRLLKRAGVSRGPQFHWHVLDKGIQHRYIRPGRPYLNGKTERSHRFDDEEFYRQLEGVVISSVAEFNDLLQEWERFYN